MITDQIKSSDGSNQLGLVAWRGSTHFHKQLLEDWLKGVLANADGFRWNGTREGTAGPVLLDSPLKRFRTKLGSTMKCV